MSQQDYAIGVKLDLRNGYQGWTGNSTGNTPVNWNEEKRLGLARTVEAIKIDAQLHALSEAVSAASKKER